MSRDLEPACSGLARGKPPTVCILVIFGASGDLARNKLLPALFVLSRQRLLPEPFAILGFARREWGDETFRREMGAAIAPSNASASEWQTFARNLYYVCGDFTATEAYAALRQRIQQIQSERNLPDNVLFHLSTPPHFYSEITDKLSAASLLSSDRGWRRLVIEKPFGHDEESARALDRRLLSVLREEQIFRVDHYLGKETVQNMLVFRFANPGFEPVWNRDHIDHVQITAAESEGIGTRANFYDRTGVIRDMVQSHLLQLLCMTAMDPPVSYDGTSLRNETLKVLQSIRPLDYQQDCVIGQYGAGEIEGFAVPGYREEVGVADGSKTPTFVALRLHLDSWRWSDVPFYLRTGKRLPRKLTEISIHFKPTPHLMFPVQPPGQLQHNTLTFRLQPDEGIFHQFLAKQPGPDLCLRPVTMRFHYETAFGIDELPGAYEWLLLDAMHGDQTLFPRSDWIYKAWSIVDSLIRQAETEPPMALPTYAAGTKGPAASNALLERDGRLWLA